MSDLIDAKAGHKFFAANCFNAAWDLLDKESRTDEETEMMIDLAHAARAHWRNSDDRSPRTESVGARQISRVYAVAGRPDEALRYGTESLDVARRGGIDEFYVGYGHEAVARAAAEMGDCETAELHLEAARALLASITDTDSREALSADLDSVAV